MAETVSGDTPTEDAEHLTHEGALLGTLSYIAPEQARGVNVGPKSDQFALAATAYEALAGRLPWTGRNIASVLAQILVDEAPAPSTIESSLPAAVDAVFAKALAKEPEERFEDAGTFSRTLQEAFEPDAVPIDSIAPPPPKRSWTPILLAAGVVISGGLALSVLLRPHDPTPPPPPPHLENEAVVGCPIFEAEGVEEPNGWLGAMAADLACRRATVYLGGNPRRAREPAELLDLPRIASDGFPSDPYVAPDARERSLEAARQLDGMIDGTVRHRDNGTFLVQTVLRVDGEELRETAGEGETIHEATRHAIDQLVQHDFPVRDAIDREFAPWLGTADRDIALHYEDLGEAVLTGIGIEEHCTALIARADELGPLRGEVGRVCARFRVEGAQGLDRPDLDRSSLGALALTAAEHADRLEENEVRDLADQLATERLREQRPYARATLARGEILLYEQLGEMDRARDLLLTAPDNHPEDWFLRVHLVRAMRRTSGVRSATYALAAWHPGTPEAWRTLALPIRRDHEEALPWLRRAYVSGGALPLMGIELASALLATRRGRGEVRAIAARYGSSGARGRLAGQYLQARLEVVDAQLGAALTRLQEALMVHDRFGRLVDGDAAAVVWLIDLAIALERGPEVAGPLAQRFVLAEPHRLDLGQPHYEVPMIRLCMIASPEVAAPCLTRLRDLRAGRAARAGRVDGAGELLEGALHFVADEYDEAIEAWRPLVRTRASWLPPKPFEVRGDEALLERLVRAQLRRDTLAGARPVHAEEAVRAARRGDAERARELAQQVLDAWAAADVPVPAVQRMRGLLADL